MAKDNQKGGQKPSAIQATSSNLGSSPLTPAKAATPAPSAGSALPDKGKQGKKSAKPAIGGPAVPGAKSTLPRQVNTSDPEQQQMANYNHDMRRRMKRMGLGTKSAGNMQDQRRKRLEKRKRRLEERKQEVKKVAAGAPKDISLGRRNTYFLIAVAVIIVGFIIVAIIVNHGW